MKNIFDLETTQEIINRIHKLNPSSPALWGTMSVDKMLAHCNVTYEMIYEDKHKKTGAFTKFMLKLFVKDIVVNDKPYKKISRTAPAFIITDSRDFEKEKNRLIGFMEKTQALGAVHFDGKDSHSFGKLNSKEWHNMFYKHLDHHLSQFGV